MGVLAKRTSYALNVAIGAQVVLGAFTTGIAASTSGRQVIYSSILRMCKVVFMSLLR